MKTFSFILKALNYASATVIVFTLVSILSGCGPNGRVSHGFGDEGDGNGGYGTALMPKRDPVPRDPEYITDGSFESYIDTFKSDSDRIVGHEPDTSALRIIFGDTAQRGSRVIGFCQFLNNGQNLIVVNEAWWNGASDIKREAMLFHEMGHCVLLRAHKTEFRTTDLSPISLMYSFLLKPDVYAKYHESYLQELFTQKLPAISRPTAVYAEEDGGISWNLRTKESECNITLDQLEGGALDSTQHRH